MASFRNPTTPALPPWYELTRSQLEETARRAAARGRRRQLTLALVAALATAGLTAVARAYHVAWSLDIYVDEFTYLDLARHLLDHGRVATEVGPFYLHPPGFFLLAALYLKATQVGGSLIEQVQSLRFLTIILATLLDVAVFVVAYRLRGFWAATSAGVLFAVDPFLVRFGSLVMLETAAVFWAIAGMAVLAAAVAGRHPPSARNALLTGLLFGFAILTKDLMVFITVLPLAILCALDRNAYPIRRAAVSIVTAGLVYGAYVGWVAAIGDLPVFLAQKLHGLRRAAGAVQESGFNQPGQISLSHAVLNNVFPYGMTYALMALGLVAAVVLFFYRGRANRMAAVWMGSAVAYMSYAVVKGTLEEQYFYMLLVMAILAVSVAAPQVLERVAARPRAFTLIRRRPSASSGRRWAAAAALMAVTLVAFDAGVWLSLRSQADNGYERLTAYMASEMPAGSTVAVDPGDALWVAATRPFPDVMRQGQGLPYANQVLGPWATKVSDRDHHAQYVIVNEKLVRDHYAVGSPAYYAWLTNTGTPVFSFEGDSYYRLAIYRLPQGY